MSEHVIPGRAGDLIPLSAADVLWAGLTAGSAVPTAAGVFACLPAGTRAGYVLLGSRVVAVVKASGGRWGVAESEVRRAAAGLSAVEMDCQDLVRIGPFRRVQRQGNNEGTLLRWRQRVMQAVQELGGPGQLAPGEDGRSCHLAGIDWRQVLVERAREGSVRTWWLPRAVVRLLDAAEHAETQWLHTALARQAAAVDTGRPSQHRQHRAADSRQTANPEGPTSPLRPYKGELEGQLYSVLSRKPGFSGKVAQWACAVCCTTPATVLDHCHEHGYARGPLTELTREFLQVRGPLR